MKPTAAQWVEFIAEDMEAARKNPQKMTGKKRRRNECASNSSSSTSEVSLVRRFVL